MIEADKDLLEADKDLLEAARNMDELLTEKFDTDLIETLCACNPAYMQKYIELLVEALYEIFVKDSKEEKQRTE